MRTASVANGGDYDSRVYKQALDAQMGSNLSGLALTLHEATSTLHQEARSLGEGTDYVNKHPVVALFLHQMAHLNGSHADLLGDNWTTVYKACQAMAGFFREDYGSLSIVEAGAEFRILYHTRAASVSMGDCVDRYSDETGVSYHVGTPEFYELMRADLRANYDTLIEAYFTRKEEGQ